MRFPHLFRRDEDVIAVGDAKMPGNIGSALRSAMGAALVI